MQWESFDGPSWQRSHRSMSLDWSLNSRFGKGEAIEVEGRVGTTRQATVTITCRRRFRIEEARDLGVWEALFLERKKSCRVRPNADCVRNSHRLLNRRHQVRVRAREPSMVSRSRWDVKGSKFERAQCQKASRLMDPSHPSFRVTYRRHKSQYPMDGTSPFVKERNNRLSNPNFPITLHCSNVSPSW